MQERRSHEPLTAWGDGVRAHGRENEIAIEERIGRVRGDVNSGAIVEYGRVVSTSTTALAHVTRRSRAHSSGSRRCCRHQTELFLEHVDRVRL